MTPHFITEQLQPFQGTLIFVLVAGATPPFTDTPITVSKTSGFHKASNFWNVEQQFMSFVVDASAAHAPSYQLSPLQWLAYLWPRCYQSLEAATSVSSHPFFFPCLVARAGEFCAR